VQFILRMASRHSSVLITNIDDRLQRGTHNIRWFRIKKTKNLDLSDDLHISDVQIKTDFEAQAIRHLISIEQTQELCIFDN